MTATWFLVVLLAVVLLFVIARGRELLRMPVLVILAVRSAIAFAGSLAEEGYAAWPGLVVGALVTGGTAMVSGQILDGAINRAKAAGAARRTGPDIGDTRPSPEPTPRQRPRRRLHRRRRPHRRRCPARPTLALIAGAVVLGFTPSAVAARRARYWSRVADPPLAPDAARPRRRGPGRVPARRRLRMGGEGRGDDRWVRGDGIDGAELPVSGDGGESGGSGTAG